MTIDKKFFPELWEARTWLIEKQPKGLRYEAALLRPQCRQRHDVRRAACR